MQPKAERAGSTRLAAEPVGEFMEIVATLPELPEPDARAEAEQVLADNLAQERRRLQRAVKGLGIPFRHARVLVSGQPFETEATRYMEKWRDRMEYGAVLVLSGEVGCGKSFAAAACVWKGPPRPYPFGDEWPPDTEPRFVTVGRLQALGLFGKDELEPILAASVLAIDDAGTEFADEKGAFASLFHRIIDERHGAPTWTVLTSNTSLEVFGKRFGPRIVDRLREVGCGFVHLREPSLRGRGKRQGDGHATK